MKAEGLGVEEQHSQQNSLFRWRLLQAQQILNLQLCKPQAPYRRLSPPALCRLAACLTCLSLLRPRALAAFRATPEQHLLLPPVTRWGTIPQPVAPLNPLLEPSIKVHSAADKAEGGAGSIARTLPQV